MSKEEGKKRWRPSIEEFRALEREYGDALEAYAVLKERYAELDREHDAAVDTIRRLRSRGLLRRILNR